MRLLLCSFLLSLLLFNSKTWAVDASIRQGVVTTEIEVFPASTAPLPKIEIEARQYPVQVLKKSHSERYYHLSDPSAAKPRVGNVVLLKRGDQPVMALRIVRTAVESKEFYAKRIRRYGDVYSVPEGESFSAVEKVNDIGPEPLPAGATDDPELLALTRDQFYAVPPQNQLVAEAPAQLAPPSDAPLPEIPPENAELSPDGPPDTAGIPVDEILEETEDDPNAAPSMASSDIETINEMETLHPHNHSLTGEYASMVGGTDVNTGDTESFSAFGLRYGLTLGRMIFARSAHNQDSIALDAGFFYYKVSNYRLAGDSYNVFPIVATLRYNLYLTDTFGIHLYGGVAPSVVLGSTDATSDGLSSLQTVLPAAGGGILYQLGPHWYARADVGIDMVGGGLMISF